mgnify:CR=1 FL=1
MVLDEKYKEIATRLFSFLSKEGVLVQFICNVEYEDVEEEEKYSVLKLPFTEVMQGLIKSLPEDMLIEGAFFWNTSPEGVDFWGKINDKWAEYCDINS